jgi:hypothetical protein
MPQIIILGVFGLLFLLCLWAYLKERKEGRGSVKGKDAVFFLVRVVVYGGGILFLIFVIFVVMYYAGGGH